MTTRPSVFPDWAVNPDGTDHDVADGTTGQNNVVVPPPEKTLIGWQYNEKPPRQYFNWLARIVTQWIRWLDANTTQTALLSVTIPIGTPVFSHSFTLPTGFTWDNAMVISGQSHDVVVPVSYWGAFPLIKLTIYGGVPVLQKIEAGTVSTSPTLLTIESSASDGNPAHTLDLAGWTFNLLIKARP